MKYVRFAKMYGRIQMDNFDMIVSFIAGVAFGIIVTCFIFEAAL